MDEIEKLIQEIFSENETRIINVVKKMLINEVTYVSYEIMKRKIKDEEDFDSEDLRKEVLKILGNKKNVA